MAIGILIMNSSCYRNKEQLDLKLNPMKGDEQTYIYTAKTEGSLANINTEVEMTFKTLSNKNGKIEYEVDFVSIISKSNLFGEDETYDSRMDEASMSESQLEQHADYKPLLDSILSLSMDSRGGITKELSFSNGDIVRSLPFDFNHIQLVFPEEKVRVGGSWNREWTSTFLNRRIIKGEYYIMDITESEVEIKSKLNIPPVVPPMEMSVSWGKYILDKKTGLLIEGTLKQDLQMGGKLTISFKQKD